MKMQFEILACRKCRTTFSVATKSIGNRCGAYSILRNSLDIHKYCCNKPDIHWYISPYCIWLFCDIRKMKK